MTKDHLPALPLVAAVGSGALIAVQQRLNGDLGRSLHNPLLAAVVSFGTGLAVMAVLVLRRSARQSLAGLSVVPWWARLGGLGGATLVAVGATAAPEIGVALLTVGLVSGSTIGGLAVDKMGLAPGGRRPLSGPRLAGAGLCLVATAVSAVEGLRAASPLLLGLVVLAGGLTSAQQAVTGQVRQATTATAATFVNFVVGTTALLLGLSLQALVSGVRADSWPTHWWLYLGGPLGASFVAVAALVVRSLGVLRLGLALTAGQLLGGILIDLDRGVATTTLAAAGLTMVAVLVSGLGQRRLAGTGVNVELTPRRLTVVCRVVAFLVLAVFGVLALLLPRGGTDGERFGVGDQVAFFGIGLLLAGGVLAFTRARVRADDQGVWVRNVMGDRFFPWAVVVGIDLPDGSSWAQLELHDDETVALLAIQSNDGDAAIDAVLALRKLLQTARHADDSKT